MGTSFSSECPWLLMQGSHSAEVQSHTCMNLSALQGLFSEGHPALHVREQLGPLSRLCGFGASTELFLKSRQYLYPHAPAFLQGTRPAIHTYKPTAISSPHKYSRMVAQWLPHWLDSAYLGPARRPAMLSLLHCLGFAMGASWIGIQRCSFHMK